jgi:hypothetical protein
MTTPTLAAVTPSKVRSISTAFFLRVASLLTVLHCIGHTLGGVFGVDAPPGTKERTVIDAMKSNQFEVMGATRSFWDFFIGYGLTISVSSLVQAVLFWQLAGIAKIESGRIRPVIAAFLCANIGFAILAWRYFFIPPFVGSVLTTIVLGLAYLGSGSNARRGAAL